MRKIILATAFALALGGCSITSQDAKDAATATLQATCVGVGPADAVFQSYAATGRVSASTIRIERDAVAVIISICNDWAVNPNFNLQNGLRAAANAMAALVSAELQAKAQVGA